MHSAFGWTKAPRPDAAYVVMTDDEEATDTDIIEITNPSRPTLVARVRPRRRSPRQPLGAVHGDAVFIHDEVVKKINGRYIGLLSYWDGGYIKVDVTDPANPVFLGDTEYAAVDPVAPRVARALRSRPRATATRPSSRATTSSSSPPTRTSTRTASTAHDHRRPHAGTSSTAIQGSDVPQPIDDDTSLSATPAPSGWAATRRRSRRPTPRTRSR